MTTELKVIEDLQGIGYSRIGAGVRRSSRSFKYLKTITVSPYAPPWYHIAKGVQREGVRGVPTIKMFDTPDYTEVWYKTTTRGHKARVYAR